MGKLCPPSGCILLKDLEKLWVGWVGKKNIMSEVRAILLRIGQLLAGA